MKFSFTIVLLGLGLVSFAQASKDTSAPYFKDQSLPNFTLSLAADSSDFNSNSLPKNEILFIIYFNPECEHCQKEAVTYLSKMDSLKNIKTIWIAAKYVELKMIREFAEKYQLQKLNAIAVGKEIAYNLPLFYRLESTPYGVVYSNDKMKVEYRGDFNYNDLIAINYGNYTAKPIAPILPEPKKTTKSKQKKVKG